MRIFLWGMMGSGKTFFLNLLAKNSVRLKLFDLDQIIENSANKTIAELFSDNGEEFFRLIEHQTLKKLIDSDDDFVLATGGGTPCFFDNAQLMKNNGLTIYLKADPKILAKRLWTEKQKRPLISNFNNINDLEQYLTKLLHQRENFYSQAHITWDTQRNPNELTTKIKKFAGCS